MLLEGEDFIAGHDFGAVLREDGRYNRFAAGGDDDVFGLEGFGAAIVEGDVDAMGITEGGAAHEDFNAAGFE